MSVLRNISNDSKTKKILNYICICATGIPLREIRFRGEASLPGVKIALIVARTANEKHAFDWGSRICNWRSENKRDTYFDRVLYLDAVWIIIKLLMEIGIAAWRSESQVNLFSSNCRVIFILTIIAFDFPARSTIRPWDTIWVYLRKNKNCFILRPNDLIF